MTARQMATSSSERSPERHPEHQDTEAQQQAHLDDQQGKPGEHERREVLGPRHGRGDEALEQPLLPGIHDGKAHAPDAASHEVHPEQARHQEVDVAGAPLVHQLGRSPAPDRVGPRLAATHRPPAGARSGSRAGCRRSGTPPARRPGTTTNATSPVRSASAAAESLRTETWSSASAAQRVRQPGRARVRRHDRHAGALGRPVSEGDAESRRQQHGEDEDPEHRLRLAEELAIAHPGELDQRMVGPATPLTHRAGAAR